MAVNPSISLISIPPSLWVCWGSERVRAVGAVGAVGAASTEDRKTSARVWMVKWSASASHMVRFCATKHVFLSKIDHILQTPTKKCVFFSNRQRIGQSHPHGITRSLWHWRCCHPRAISAWLHLPLGHGQETTCFLRSKKDPMNYNSYSSP